MPRLQVSHSTRYNYAEPVAFGPHRLMVRPRDSHDLDLLDATLAVDPLPASIQWFHDVFGNSVAMLTFDTSATSLGIHSTLTVETFKSAVEPVVRRAAGSAYPVRYTPDEVADLGRLRDPHYPDPDERLADWLTDLLGPACAVLTEGTVGVLDRLAEGIHAILTYEPREAEGTQAPANTLASGSGTCRDYALLYMELARRLGFAARFVTGYLVLADPDDPDQMIESRGGTTHAWAEVYLPAYGWVEYDPTNKIRGSGRLIRVAVTRDPSQAVPIGGSFFGTAQAAVELNVDVSITLKGDEASSR